MAVGTTAYSYRRHLSPDVPQDYLYCLSSLLFVNILSVQRPLPSVLLNPPCRRTATSILRDLEEVLERDSRLSRGYHGFTDITQNTDVDAHGTVVADTART